jgi:hypothetical protein
MYTLVGLGFHGEVLKRLVAAFGREVECEGSFLFFIENFSIFSTYS